MVTKEKLNKTQCNDIKAKTSDKAGLQLSWACNICSSKKRKKKRNDGGRQRNKEKYADGGKDQGTNGRDEET